MSKGVRVLGSPAARGAARSSATLAEAVLLWRRESCEVLIPVDRCHAAYAATHLSPGSLSRDKLPFRDIKLAGAATDRSSAVFSLTYPRPVARILSSE
jgi:hypothetical protein